MKKRTYPRDIYSRLTGSVLICVWPDGELEHFLLVGRWGTIEKGALIDETGQLCVNTCWYTLAWDLHEGRQDATDSYSCEWTLM